MAEQLQEYDGEYGINVPSIFFNVIFVALKTCGVDSWADFKKNDITTSKITGQAIFNEISSIFLLNSTAVFPFLTYFEIFLSLNDVKIAIQVVPWLIYKSVFCFITFKISLQAYEQSFVIKTSETKTKNRNYYEHNKKLFALGATGWAFKSPVKTMIIYEYQLLASDLL